MMSSPLGPNTTNASFLSPDFAVARRAVAASSGVLNISCAPAVLASISAIAHASGGTIRWIIRPICRRWNGLSLMVASRGLRNFNRRCGTAALVMGHHRRRPPPPPRAPPPLCPPPPACILAPPPLANLAPPPPANLAPPPPAPRLVWPRLDCTLASLPDWRLLSPLSRWEGFPTPPGRAAGLPAPDWTLPACRHRGSDCLRDCHSPR